MSIQVGQHLIGEGQKPFIIAEVGSNWRSFDDCTDSIVKAAACGADAVKFQAYSYEALYGHAGSLPGALPLEWLPKLAEKAKVCGIEFMCSAFSPELVDAVNPFVNVHKVASAEMTHVRILEKLRRLGKPVILSTGASGTEDIREALKYLEGIPVVLMYCVAAYPAREVHLDGIHWLRDTFGKEVGYSDHSTDALIVPTAAVKTGASVIEKHVNFVEADGPDAPHSISTEQFKRMIDMIYQRLPFIPISPEEQPMVLRHNRRLIATRDIEQGQVLVEGHNFGIYRALKDDCHALSPFAIDQVNGKRAVKTIRAGEGIGPGDV